MKSWTCAQGLCFSFPILPDKLTGKLVATHYTKPATPSWSPSSASAHMSTGSSCISLVSCLASSHKKGATPGQFHSLDAVLIGSHLKVSAKSESAWKHLEKLSKSQRPSAFSEPASNSCDVQQTRPSDSDSVACCPTLLTMSRATAISFKSCTRGMDCRDRRQNLVNYSELASSSVKSRMTSSSQH